MEDPKKEPKKDTTKKEKIKTPVEKKATTKPPEPKSDSTPPSELNIEEEKISAMSITALCFGIASVILCCYGANLVLGVVAVILGFIEKKNITDGDSTLRSLPLANWAVGLGFAGAAIFLIQIILFVALGVGTFVLSGTQ